MVATLLLFYEDAYLRETDAKVMDIRDRTVWLDRTIFFAESGGQVSDRGTINGVWVVDMTENFGHVLERRPHFSVGDVVHLVLDWDRRYRIMRLHSAAHIVYFAVREVLGELRLIGSHVGEDKARLDFEYHGRISEHFPEVMRVIDDTLSEPRNIEIYRHPERPEIRIWRLGRWEIPCSGLHVRSTTEIGRITIKRRNLGRGKERIEIYVD